MYLHDLVHLIIDNVPSLPEVHGVDNFVIPVLFITIQIFRLTSVTAVVEDQ